MPRPVDQPYLCIHVGCREMVPQGAGKLGGEPNCSPTAWSPAGRTLPDGKESWWLPTQKGSSSLQAPLAPAITHDLGSRMGTPGCALLPSPGGPGTSIMSPPSLISCWLCPPISLRPPWDVAEHPEPSREGRKELCPLGCTTHPSAECQGTAGKLQPAPGSLMWRACVP